ncbi:hypothetical protein CYMTET_11616 [Cymbomonas tetramitiformis]|uniref:Chromo domain-containing protein n=1 Tax=Cymbomonas tetramitiformis TaxID=36881 RepID=A0AAE0GM64_9CHLO|nr:hypothetical protein CYMTET_11616 [Cymbomonas tetramitiformis]
MRGRGKRPRHAKKGEQLLSQGKGPVKRTQLHPFDAAGSDEVEYEVERILAERSSYGEAQFFIKWKDLSEDSNTWEPLTNLPGHDAEIELFREDLRKTQDEIARKAAAAKASSNVEVEETSGLSHFPFSLLLASLRLSLFPHFHFTKYH